MNIGIDARMYGPEVGGGGLGRYVEQLVNELQVSDHKNRYVLFLKKENFDSCKIVNPNFEKRLADVHWYGVEEQLKMESIVDREHLDLVHFPHWNIPLFLRTPFVVTIHDLILLDEPFSSKISTRHKAIFTLKYWAYKLVLSHAIMRAKKVIAVSHATASSVKKHFAKIDIRKIEIVYEGVTSLPIQPTPLPLTPYPYLLYVGNAYPHKNLPKLIEAFQLLHIQHPDLKLILAGRESVFYKELMMLARAGSGDPAYNDVEFVLNPSDDGLSKLYCGALMYVYPSRIEGFGLPPLEAMSVGVPVAASAISSLEEILGDAAAYFNPNDSANIAVTISNLLDDQDQQKQLIAKGYEQIKKYSWKKMATDIQNIYQTCGEKNP